MYELPYLNPLNSLLDMSPEEVQRRRGKLSALGEVYLHDSERKESSAMRARVAWAWAVVSFIYVPC